MFTSLARQKSALRELVSRLRKDFSYASVLAVADDSRSWSVSRSGKSISTGSNMGGTGYVVRVFDKKGCFEYSFNSFSRKDIPAIVGKIKESAASQYRCAAAASLATPVPDDKPARMTRSAKFRTDPRSVSDGEILGRLDAFRSRGISHEGILDFSCRVSYRAYRKIFISENRELDQSVMWTTAAVVALASRGEEIKDYYRSFSNLGGLEILDKVGDCIDEVAENTLELLKSEPMIPGEYECVCDPEVTGMIVHEAFGHGVEMDMFVKDRAQAKDFIGQYVASPLVSMHDGNAVDEVATAFFDDEGNLTSDTLIIDKGILRTGICDGLSAGRLGVAPTGNGRRESYERKAYTRMTNTYFAKGRSTPERMIKSVKYGFLLENPSSGMEDPKNWGIQCMVNIAREIKDGKLTGRIFSPIVLTGYVPDLLKSITMTGNRIELGGGGYCGKGHKEWVKVSDGGPYIKARIRLG